MKILMINKFFYRRSGVEAYMFDFIDLLRQNGHQVIEFSMQDEKNNYSKFAQYFIKNLDFNKREGLWKDLKKALHLLYSFEARNKLEKLILKEKPEIAHLHNVYFHLTPSILAVLKKHKIPVVWTMHDYHLICPNYKLFTQDAICERCKIHKYYNCFKYRCIKNTSSQSFLAMLEMYLHKVILRSYKYVDLFIAPSKFMAKKLIEWRIENKKVKQVYNFILFSSAFSSATKTEELGEGIVYFGRLGVEKGIFTLLEAMKKMSEIKLKLIGEGPERPEIENYIQANKLDNVTIHSHLLDKNKLFELVKNSRLVVLPSIWYENNPISILEAFALGKTVIGSNIGGIPELIKDGQTGFLFKLGEAADLAKKIKENYNNSALLRKIGENAQKFVAEEFGAKKHYEDILNIYKGLVKNS